MNRSVAAPIMFTAALGGLLYTEVPASLLAAAANDDIIWEMHPRFGISEKRTQTIPAVQGFAAGKTREYEIIAMEGEKASRCYVHPESSGCATNPWRVTFKAPPSVQGKRLKWEIPGVCGDVTKAELTCEFPRLGSYPVSLKAADPNGVAQILQQRIELKDYLIVVVGDSVASGEGVPDALSERVGTIEIPLFNIEFPLLAPKIYDNLRCHRSARSGFAIAAKRFEDSDPHSSVTFVNLACSGASIDDGLLGTFIGRERRNFRCASDAYGLNVCSSVAEPHICTPWGCWELIAPQIDALATLLCPKSLPTDEYGRITKSCGKLDGGRRIAALMMSIGANDLHFSDIVRACLAFENCHRRGSTHRYWRSEINDLARALADLNSRLKALPKKYDSLDDAIRNKLDVYPESVIIAEVFDPTRDKGGKYCDRDGGNAYEIAKKETQAGTLFLPYQIPDPVLDFDGLKAPEYKWARKSLIQPLNKHIHSAAKRHNWKLAAGIFNAYDGHGLCADDNWVAGLDRSFEVQSDYYGTMHPNRTGHRAHAEKLYDVLVRVIADY